MSSTIAVKNPLFLHFQHLFIGIALNDRIVNGNFNLDLNYG